jgi:hypothetical protein
MILTSGRVFAPPPPQSPVEATLRGLLATTNVIVEADWLPVASRGSAPVDHAVRASRIVTARADVLIPSRNEEADPCTPSCFVRQLRLEVLLINQLHLQFSNSAHDARLFAQAKQFDFANHFINSKDCAATS